MLNATKISGDTWCVTEIDDAGESMATHKVAVRGSGNAADAIAALAAMQAGPTADQLAAQALTERVHAIRTECTRRIYHIADYHAQIKLASASGAGLLSAGQMTAYQAGLGWIAAMRLVCAGLVGDVMADFMAEAAWPDIPSGVAELAAEF